jgi:putative membrane protein
VAAYLSTGVSHEWLVMPPPYNNEGVNDMMGFGFILMLVFWVAIIALVAWLFSGLFHQAKGASLPLSTARSNDSPESPLDILKRRYARGEISKAEYEEMRRDLVG